MNLAGASIALGLVVVATVDWRVGVAMFVGTVAWCVWNNDRDPQ